MGFDKKGELQNPHGKKNDESKPAQIGVKEKWRPKEVKD